MRAGSVRRRALAIGALVVAASIPAGAQTPAAATAAKAKEVASLMQAKKLEAFAMRDTIEPGRYVAVLVVPNVQLLVVSAAYSREADLEYSLYTKNYQNAYLDLKAGALATNRFFVDDAMGDGLVAVPGRRVLQHDAVIVDGAKHVFDGVFNDRKSGNKVTEDVYKKAFADAEERYTKVLDRLIAELKRSGE